LLRIKVSGRSRWIEASRLQKSCFLETEETLSTADSLADDNVIQKIDLKNSSSGYQALSEL